MFIEREGWQRKWRDAMPLSLLSFSTCQPVLAVRAGRKLA